MNLTHSSSLTFFTSRKRFRCPLSLWLQGWFIKNLQCTTVQQRFSRFVLSCAFNTLTEAQKYSSTNLKQKDAHIWPHCICFFPFANVFGGQGLLNYALLILFLFSVSVIPKLLNLMPAGLYCLNWYDVDSSVNWYIYLDLQQAVMDFYFGMVKIQCCSKSSFYFVLNIHWFVANIMLDPERVLFQV